MGSITHPQMPHNTRLFAWISVAVCLALAGGLVAFALLRSSQQPLASELRAANEARERRSLVEGWSELGALAALDNRAAGSQATGNQQHADQRNANQQNTDQPLTNTPAPLRNAAQPEPPVPSDASVPDARPTDTPSLAASAAPSAVATLAPSAALTNPQNSTGSPAPAAPAKAAPAVGEECGSVTCASGEVCCNASCGTCLPPGQKCSQTVCGMSAWPASVQCGSATCNVGDVCCNQSCGTCTHPGTSCDTTPCANAIQDPNSPTCGLKATCNVGTVCCNPSCGICAPPSEPCSQTICD